MNKRRLGRTGLQVTEIGLGAWPIGGRDYDVKEKESISSVETYLKLGGNCIDTALSYGKSEYYIGQAIAGFDRNEIVLMSKTPSAGKLEKVGDIERDLETSLVNLGTGWIDVYFMHTPPEDARTIEAALLEMKKLKDQKLIGFIGASIKGHNVTDQTVQCCRKYMDQGEVDVFQIIYSPLRQKLDYDEVMEQCGRRGIGLVIRTVLENGFLTGKYPNGYRFPERDHRSRYSAT